MLQTETDARFNAAFDDLPEMIHWIETYSRQWRQQSSVKEGRDHKWDFNAGYEGALKLAKSGWEEGIRNLAALATAVPNNSITVREYGVAGEFPDVPRFLAGDPFNMVHRGKQRVPKPSMTIAINICASAIVTAMEMANYGAAMVALVDRLEAKKVRVELIGVMAFAGLGGGRKAGISWGLKRQEDHLDLAAIAFSLAHPACFRRIGFAAIERTPRRFECGGYGQPGGVVAEDIIGCPPGALIIDGVGFNPGACRTMEGALALAKSQINKAAGADIVELEDLDDT